LCGGAIENICAAHSHLDFATPYYKGYAVLGYVHNVSMHACVHWSRSPLLLTNLLLRRYD